MKTQHEHKLKSNELADVLGHELDVVRPYMKTILAVIIGVAAIGLTWAYLSGRSAQKNAAAWGEFYEVISSDNPEDIDKFAASHPGTQAALWTQLAVANRKLAEGSGLMFRDRKDADVSLDQAKKAFLEVKEKSPAKSMMQRQAILGLAQTYEALNDPETALPYYEQLLKENPDDAYGKAASERITQVKRLNDAQWFSWFAKQEPPKMPTDPLGGRDPSDLHNLPTTSDLKPPRQPGEYNFQDAVNDFLKDSEKDKKKKDGDEPGLDLPGPTDPTPDDAKKGDVNNGDKKEATPPTDDTKKGDPAVTPPPGDTPAVEPPAPAEPKKDGAAVDPPTPQDANEPSDSPANDPAP